MKKTRSRKSRDTVPLRSPETYTYMQERRRGRWRRRLLIESEKNCLGCKSCLQPNYQPICPGDQICQLWLPFITELPSDYTAGYPPVCSKPNYRPICPGDQICQLWLPLITELPSDYTVHMATLLSIVSPTTDPSVLGMRSVSYGYLSSLSFLLTTQMATLMSIVSPTTDPSEDQICQLWLPLITELPSDYTVHLATFLSISSPTTDPSVLRIRSVSGGYLSSLIFLLNYRAGYLPVYIKPNYRPICPEDQICQWWLPLITELPSDNRAGYPPVYSKLIYRPMSWGPDLSVVATSHY
jgi:hypothetical protein